ncbi:hypothetical protein [Amycolatopsis vancoresmycina]|uniref:Uncharacterized protein n=1 Tax=Amycolatopsis vancoresmycina DSM 44592 TaxID=1292037 RepID=R1I3L2_9PSEU|nr:hypothetical protein [Amycolatopsis vancoresmycina]EOD70385.1 hypothetical protein H480_01207 [Amycolatopsis vancoresmycina DSM 44592]
MKEFENALAAAFGVGPAETPGLAIDQLDGTLSGTAAVRASTCVTRADADPVRGCGGVCYCRVEPVLATVTRAEPVRVTGLCGGHHTEQVHGPIGTCYCRAEPVPAHA